jgi:hypothetical protein
VQYDYTDAGSGDSGVCSIQGNALDFSIDSAISWPFISSKFMLRGDFDVQVDWAIDSRPDSAWAVLMSIGDADDDVNGSVSSVHRALSGMYRDVLGYLQSTNNVGYATDAILDIAGKFRLVRSGTTVTCYYWSGVAWVSLVSDSSFSTADMYVKLSARAQWATTLNANFDNFQVNSGTIVWPETPKKLAFEIGDTGVQTYAEIERWDYNTKSAQLWIKCPTLSAVSSTILNLYYDSAGPDNTGYIGDTGDVAAQQVWDSNFVAVYHMSQDPSAGGACILDSTVNGNHGTPYGSMTSGDLVAGHIGKAIEFDGVDDYIDLGNGASLYPATAINIETSVSCPNTILQAILATELSTSIVEGFGHRINSGATITLRARIGGVEIAQISTATIAANIPTYIASSYNGSTFNSYIDGTEIISGSASGTIDYGAGTYKIARRSRGDFPAYLQGVVEEVRISNIARSVDWLAATNLSNKDLLVVFSLPSANAVLQAITDMLYGNLTAMHSPAVDMPYAMLFPRSTSLEMIYGLKLGMSMAMYYGDAPALLKIINQYYGDAPALQRSVVMPYGDMLMIQKTTNMPYHIFKPLQQVMEARYGINGEVLQSIMEQNYSLSEYNLLMKKLDMPYLLQSDSMVQSIATSLTIAGVDIAFHHLNIECSRDSFVITGEAHLADLGQYMAINKGDVVDAVCNETTFNLIVESKKRSRPGGAATTFIVNFTSPAIQLTAPWSKPLSQEFSAGLAETTINTLLDDLGPCEYLTTTFPVLADTLYANDEDARTVIRKLTQSVGAVMQSDPDGMIRVEPEYPKGWNTDAAIEYFMTDERNFVSQDESPEAKTGENKYLVGNMLSSDERTWVEQRSISDTEVEVLGFQVPWGHKEIYGLTHSGGEWVVIPEYIGVVEEIYPALEDDAEQIEFKAGFANASRPIYGGLQVNWLRQSLGAISYAEDGKLEAEVKDGETDGYGLCEIRYLTRYHLWKVRDDVSEDVQYILWVDK